MITFAIEFLSEVLPEVEWLARLNYTEMVTDKTAKEFDPDWDRYLELNEIGAVRLITARHEGELVGYVSLGISPHPHYRQNVFAIVDAIYLHPRHRQGAIGIALLRYLMADAEECGAERLIIAMKVDYPLRELFAHLGFVKTEETWETVL